MDSQPKKLMQIPSLRSPSRFPPQGGTIPKQTMCCGDLHSEADRGPPRRRRGCSQQSTSNIPFSKHLQLLTLDTTGWINTIWHWFTAKPGDEGAPPTTPSRARIPRRLHARCPPLNSSPSESEDRGRTTGLKKGAPAGHKLGEHH